MGERRRGGWFATLAGCALVAVLAAACTSSGSDGDGRPGPEPGPELSPGRSPDVANSTGNPMALDVLVYNVEYGGDASTDDVIRSLDADVVGVLESYNRLPKIARKTGYPYYNVGLQLLSKYPILEPSGADGLYALIEVQPGHAVAFFNTHLDYVAYGPRLLASGMSVREVLASERKVRSSLRVQLPRMASLADAGYPVILTGDFNQPSSLDYTERTVGSHPGVTEVVPWPVSQSLVEIDFTDTFREIHPDPLTDPGITYPNPDPDREGTGDRIDYVYSGGPVHTLDSTLVGETGGPDVDVGFRPWTSDHRAVLSTFDLTPMALPTTVSLERRLLTEGEDLRVFYNSPDSSAAAVALVPEDAEAAAARRSRSLDGASGTITFATDDLEPSGYDVVMLDAEGHQIARNEFWLRGKQAEVEIATDRQMYALGEPVTIAWDDGPANRWDWIGVFRAAADDPTNDDYLLWGYTGGHDSGALPPSVSGSMTLDEASQGKPWPLPPGRYVVHYLLTDQYVSAGRTGFTVTR